MNDQSRTYYDEENNIIHNTKVLKSNICDFNDAHILVRGDITIIGHAETLTIFLLSKTKKIYLSAVTLSARDNQNHQNFLANDLKDPCGGINTKQKVKIKLQQRSIDIFFNQTFSMS